MAETVYLLCAVMSTACAFLLLRGNPRATGSKLLFWAGLCFALLALNNIILVIDLVIFPELDFAGRIWRNVIGGSAGSILTFGLIWELT